MSATICRIQRDIVGTLWCGPAAIAAVTGRPVSEVLSCAKAVRKQTREVKRMHCHDVRDSLAMLGFPKAQVRWLGGRLTFKQWRTARPPEGRAIAQIVLVTGHFVVVAGNRFVDNQYTDPILAAEWRGQRKRVHAVIVPGARA